MTRYLPPRPEPPRVDRRRIPAGFAGTRATAAHVGRLIRDGAGDFYVRQKAIDILIARGVPAKDYLGEIDALFQWVQGHVRYTKDPFRIEVLHSARRMLELKAGDCDDMTILLGALVKSVGHPVRIVLTGPDPRRPDLFSHIYLEARHHDQWIPLDATMPYGIGWSPRTPVRQVLSIEEEHSDARTAPAARPATGARAGISADDRAGEPAQPRVAAGSAARHPRRGCPAQRPARESVVGGDAPPPGAGPKPLGPRTPALHLAAGARRSSAAEDDGAPAGTAQACGATGCPTAAATGADRSGRRGAGAFADATPAPSSGAPRRDPQTGGPAATAASARHESSGPLSAAIGSAAALYRQFTRLPARSLEQVSHARLMPPVVLELGRLTGLVYRSSKWVGRPRTYIHFMDDPPRLVSDVTGRRLFIVGGSYRVTARGIEG
jgi:hypothetical protein